MQRAPVKEAISNWDKQLERDLNGETHIVSKTITEERKLEIRIKQLKVEKEGYRYADDRRQPLFTIIENHVLSGYTLFAYEHLISRRVRVLASKKPPKRRNLKSLVLKSR